MTTLSFQSTILQGVGGGALGLTDSRGRLEGHTEVDGGSVGDTTLNTAGVVGLGLETTILRDDEGIVVDGTGHLATTEAGADLEALGGGNAQHGVRKLSLELVEAGLAQTHGNIADHTGDSSSDAVVGITILLNHLGHALRRAGVGAADGDELIHRLAVDSLQKLEVFRVGRSGGMFRGRREEVLVAHGGDEGDNVDIM